MVTLRVAIVISATVPESSKTETEKVPVGACEIGFLIADMVRGVMLAKVVLIEMRTVRVEVLKVEFLRLQGNDTEFIWQCMVLKSAEVKSEGK